MWEMFCLFGKLERQSFISNSQKILPKQEDIFGFPEKLVCDKKDRDSSGYKMETT